MAFVKPGIFQEDAVGGQTAQNQPFQTVKDSKSENILFKEAEGRT